MKCISLATAILLTSYIQFGSTFIASPSPFRSIHKGSLSSLSKLIEDISDSSNRRTVFVGGKGGVGKTTVSSAIAVSLASSFENDLKVLIVSTDPAHSLGDALDENLRTFGGNPVLLTDPLTGGRLHACEIDASAALESFRASLETFDVTRLAQALGVSTELLESFGLSEFSNLLNNPPPGLDELVALANVLDSDNTKGYDVVIVDTAPTGHTLRLLALPQFLDGFLGKILQLRLKLSGLASTLQAFFGNAESKQRSQAVDDAVTKLEEFRVKMTSLRSSLSNSMQTCFVVVTIPTKMSVAESKRLITELNGQGVTVTDVVVNQCIANHNDDKADVVTKYYERRREGQKRWIQELISSAEKVSGSSEFQNNGNFGPISVTSVPFFDVELVGVPALAYLGRECFVENPSFSHLMQTDFSKDVKIVICGGKGGVGKTTTSASLAISMAAQGHNVALISTDPAHSLGDAVCLNLAGGTLQECPLLGVPTTDGSLSILEVDPSQALGQFKKSIDQLLGSKGDDANDIKSALREFGDVFDTLPAGTDEVVALAKVINLVKKGGFDRIVLDTAPTGHTLRMLSTPGFLAELIDSALELAAKVNSNAAVKMLINAVGAGSDSEDTEAAMTAAKSSLLNFQFQMYDLEDMFANAEQTEFLIVTVPTELAIRESVRLLNDLTFEAPDMPIKVRNIVVNQVLSDDGNDLGTFVQRLRTGQEISMTDLTSMVSGMSNPPELTEVPYLDTEPRGVFGLKALADIMLKDETI
jgi:arsenite/tail-anchored protein-transporting ATPase